MEIGVNLEIIYQDGDLVEVRISAWNGSFGGITDAYLSRGQLGEIAAHLKGFPSSVSDSRDIVFGAFGPEFAGGGVSMLFHCIDPSAHARAEIRIESEHDSSNHVQSARLSLPVEAAAVDLFVLDLSRMDAGEVTVACLEGAILYRP